MDNRSNYEKGRDLAEIEIYKGLWRKMYELKPMVDMLFLEEKISLLDGEYNDTYVYIGINPRELNTKEKKGFRKACERLVNRKWVKSILAYGYEYRDYEKLTGLHYAGVFKLRRLYAPGVIRSMLFRGVFKKWCGNKKHVFVEKCKSKEAAMSYCVKDVGKNVKIVKMGKSLTSDIKMMTFPNEFEDSL